jgi:hypothetical protein
MKITKFVSIRANSLLKRYILLYRRRESSTNPPFFAKQSQFPAFLPQKPRFAEKTNPKRTQFKANQTQFLPSVIEDEGGQTQNKPKFIPFGQSGQSRPPQADFVCFFPPYMAIVKI